MSLLLFPLPRSCVQFLITDSNYAYVFESVGFGRVWVGRVRIGEGVYDIDTWELTRSSRFDIRIRGFGAS